jgi:hypothetical protein
MRIFWSGLAVTLGFFLLGAMPAAAESFDCPLPTARRAITNTLPSGWYMTPVQDRLTEARVDIIGGQATMVCIYGGAGNIMREVAADQTCAARSGGFECGGGSVPPPSPSSETYASGALEVRSSFSFDLDSGALGGASSDIWYESVRAGENYLTPRHGARIAVSGASEPGYDGCTAATYAATRARLETIGARAYICVRTSEGRIAQFRIDSIAGRVMTITYATWR